MSGGSDTDAVRASGQPAQAPRERYEVAVIGAGQAGLALGYYLAHQGCRFVILEAADSVAAAWRGRWDSLLLFTPRRYDALPAAPFPGDPDGYPTRNEVISYLERYAAELNLPIELNSPVHAISASDGKYLLELEGRTIEADQVVVATGPFQIPRVPSFAGELAAEVFQTHSLATGGRRTYRRERFSSSAAATPASRSRRNSQRPIPSISPSARARHRCHRDCWAAISSGGSKARTSCTRPSTRDSGGECENATTLIGSSPRSSRKAPRRPYAARRRSLRAGTSRSLTAASRMSTP